MHLLVSIVEVNGVASDHSAVSTPTSISTAAATAAAAASLIILPRVKVKTKINRLNGCDSARVVLSALEPGLRPITHTVHVRVWGCWVAHTVHVRV